MEGFGAYLPAGQRRGPVGVREIPLEAEAGPAVGVVERGGEDQRRRDRAGGVLHRCCRAGTPPTSTPRSSAKLNVEPIRFPNARPRQPGSGPRPWPIPDGQHREPADRHDRRPGTRRDHRRGRHGSPRPRRSRLRQGRRDRAAQPACCRTAWRRRSPTPRRSTGSTRCRPLFLLIFPAFSLPRAAETSYLAKGCAGQSRQPGRRFTSPANVSGRWNCRLAMAC